MEEITEAYLFTDDGNIIPVSEVGVRSITGDPKVFQLHITLQHGLNSKRIYWFVLRSMKGWGLPPITLDVTQFVKDRLWKKDLLAFYIEGTISERETSGLLLAVDEPNQSAWTFVEEEL